VVPTIRDERMALLSAPQDRRARTSRAAATASTPARRREAERHHLDRQQKASQHWHRLGIVSNHDHAGRCSGHDVFPQQPATPAFDDREVGGDLVSAIDRQIKFGRLIQVSTPECRKAPRRRG
jgi:hypothetical protein